MDIGTEWEVLNVGVLFRELRPGSWTWPVTLAPDRRVGFGLCSGTTNPMGAAINPQHFLGIRSSGSWTRSGFIHWWQTGWELIVGRQTGVETWGSGAGATLRVAKATDDGATAWYFRVSKIAGGRLQVEAFLPAGENAPNLFDFDAQMDRDVWKASVNNHDTYRETSLILDSREAILGELDSANIFSNLKTSVSPELDGIEWLAVKALRID